jgi:CCR4-NOT transcription complex subunit 1
MGSKRFYPNAPNGVLSVSNAALPPSSNTFHILRPTKAPGFVYAWLELISHRIFIARMLAHTPQQKVWTTHSPPSCDTNTC